MKKIINKIIIIALLISSVTSCEDIDNPIYDVFDGLEHGAVLRTLERVSSNFNRDDSSSKWEVIVEEQDEEMGKLLSKVDVYVSFTDKKDDGVDYSKSEVFVTSFAASDFVTSANGLPSTGISATLAETAAALGLSEGQYDGGDLFIFRLELALTDGRTFSSTDASGSLQGSYFKSPYAYAAGMLCIPAVPYAGDYKIDLQDSYGDGWNGASISVIIDGVSTDYTIDDGAAASYTVNVPDGTSTLVFKFNSGAWDGEATFQIYTPSGFLGVSAGPSPIAGEIALNLCNE